MESLGGGKTALWCYRCVFLAAIVLGSVGELTDVWQLNDVCNGLVSLPNLLALLLLSPEFFRIWKAYTERNKK